MRLDPVEINTSEDLSDRFNMAVIRQRFLRLNVDRLYRTRAGLTHHQEVFLGVLPLLFHCNHPMLPGYVSQMTPAGISGFKPSKTDLNFAKTLSRSFSVPAGYFTDNIWSIFLMGSVGTLAQSHDSDFDIWLCHKPGLSRSALKELEQKCERISKWAKTLRLDVHFFLMDCEAFKAGRSSSLNAESSGSVQRLLLLDEFYRTAVHIAGRLPLWWFVAPEHDQDYEQQAHELLHKRFLHPDSVLDFGPVTPIPANEFMGAGVWQLYKAIQSPHKSVLKVLLLETYVEECPNIRPLATDFKQQIFSGDRHLNELDPYVLIYRRIERYLSKQGDSTRLELARRCLYFKVNKPLSRSSPRTHEHSWQRQQLESLVQEWGWSMDYVRLLDQHLTWKTLRVKEERHQLVKALNHSYRLLASFAQKHRSVPTVVSCEMAELGRKLQASFERRPGKLEWINPGISRDMSEPVVFFNESAFGSAQRITRTWQAHALPNDEHQDGHIFPSTLTSADNRLLLKQAHSPVELLLWCYINGILEDHTRLDARQMPSIPDTQLRRLLQRIKQWLPLPVASPSDDAFRYNPIATRTLLLLNVGSEPNVSMGYHRSNIHVDPFCYGAQSDNLVVSMDFVIVNSWQEILCHRFEGPDCLVEWLHTYLTLETETFATTNRHLSIDIECFGNTHAAAITQRVRHWLDALATLRDKNTLKQTRYLFALGKRYFSVQNSEQHWRILPHQNTAQLMQYLAEPQMHFTPFNIDSYTLQQHPLKCIAQHLTPTGISVFFMRQGDALELYISDEHGVITTLNMPLTHAKSLMSALHLFLRSALMQLEKGRPHIKKEFSVLPIRFYELNRDRQQHITAQPRSVTADCPHQELQEIWARASTNPAGEIEYDLAIGNQTFSWRVYSHEVINKAIESLHRQNRTRFAVTRLDLSAYRDPQHPHNPVRLQHYLQVKTDIEDQLTRALPKPFRL